MTRSNALASELYKMAVGLKCINFDKLVWGKNRKSLGDSIATMQFIVYCVGMKHISDQQAEVVLHCLEHTYHYETDELCSVLREAAPQAEYTEDYDELLFEMNVILSRCSKELHDRKKGYTERVRRYIYGFHNLPRAFLPLSSKARISFREARKYAEPYLK